MSKDQDQIKNRAREKRQLRAEKRAARSKSETRLGKVIAWGGVVAGAIVLGVSSFFRWATRRKSP